MCDRMLQDSLRCYREPGRGVGWRFGPGHGVEIQDRARGGGNSGPGRGVVGIQAPGAGWAVILARARGEVGIQGLSAGWSGDSGPERGVVDFFGKMENFLPFCRFFAV